jgi:4-diphosphocytidyl-2-C-methyl-D-erythritol kinase
MICEIAPAKINLTLEILKKRNDGYHEIKSVMQTINLCDCLTIWEHEWIQIVPEYYNLPAGDALPNFDNYNNFSDNLVFKAATTLQKITGFKGGAAIQLKKTIPSCAGLGGGSSDAAATLRGLNKLWKLNLSREELAKIGSLIGSDIPFFIYGGTCLAMGRGEIIENIVSIQKKWLTLILLPLKIEQKTKRLYSFITPKDYSNGNFTTKFIRNMNNGLENNIFNVFEIVYNNVFKEYNYYLEKLLKITGKTFHLSGSGPTVFSISDSEEEAKSTLNQCEIELKLNKYIAQTVP